MRLSGRLSVYVVFALSLSVGISALAQENCPAIVQAALAAVDQVCSATARNQACYGNLKLDAVPQAGISNFQFDAPGDIVDVADIGTLRLTPLDEAARQWGVALMRLQANLPDTLPGQNVTMLLFGDVEIKAEADAQLTKPMQAFYLRTGIGDAPCLEAPDSGILVQTPQGAGIIELRVNEVDIELGSTAYLQAAPGDALTVSVVEGSALVTAFDETQPIPQGAMVAVPLDENLAASGPPGEPEPYSADDLQALPLGTLEQQVQMTEPPTKEELGQMVEAFREIMESSKDFIGLWEGIDVDGSYMTLQIHPLAGGQLYVRLYDAGASACGKKDPLDPAEAVGEGYLDENGDLVVTFQVWCLRPEREDHGEATFTITYDAASNSLADNSGVTWKRFGR